MSRRSILDGAAAGPFLRGACELALELGARVPDYPEAVRRRLELGAERYGQRAYLAPDRDNLAEAHDEAEDLGAYAVLEVERMAARGELDACVLEALAVAVAHAIVADHHMRRAQALRGAPA